VEVGLPLHGRLHFQGPVEDGLNAGRLRMHGAPPFSCTLSFPSATSAAEMCHDNPNLTDTVRPAGSVAGTARPWRRPSAGWRFAPRYPELPPPAGSSGRQNNGV